MKILSLRWINQPRVTRENPNQMSQHMPPKKRQRPNLTRLKPKLLKRLRRLKSEVEAKALGISRPLPSWNVSTQNEKYPNQWTDPYKRNRQSVHLP